MKKKILIISAVFPPEQVTSAFLNYDLAHELAKKYDVTVLRPFPTRPIGAKFESAEVEDKSFKTILVDSYTHPQSELVGRFRESIDFGRKSAVYIKEHHKEIDFVYNDGWQLFGLNIVAKACNKFGIPYMVPIQDIYPECLFTNRNYPGILKACINGVLMPIDKYYQKHAACVRTISEEMRDYLAETRGVAKENYLVVNNWQNDTDFLKEYPKRKEDGKIIYAYVGSINEHANVDLMIRAFAEVAIPNSEFRIYGGGNKKDECVQLVQQLGLSNVTFDFVSRDQIAYVQSQVDVLILALPTGNGNLCLPSKLTSYMLSGKPVLASVDEESSTKRILSSSGAGYAVKPDSLESFIDGFKYFAELNKEKLNDMGGASFHYAKVHLTREINLKLVVDRINTIIQ
ncbi:MAG: glycosyltransferase family 4 protein [Bacteroidaceae bacterium]|nr:glycosyltransferase family 4 protein [Bacteroidaceae bacterium]